MQFFSVNSLPSMGFSIPDFSMRFSISDIMNRISTIAKEVFDDLAGYFKTYDQYSEEGNLKAFALISCLSLVALLLINILFKNGKSIVSPPTPFQPPIKKRDTGS